MGQDNTSYPGENTRKSVFGMQEKYLLYIFLHKYVLTDAEINGFCYSTNKAGYDYHMHFQY